MKMRFLLVLIAGLCCLNLFNRQLSVVFAHDDDADVDVATDTTAPVEEKVKYVKPVPKGPHHFLETFDIDTIGSKWIKSLAKKADVDEIIAKYEGEWAIESAIQSALDGDKGLVLKSKAKHHAISAKLLKPFQFKGDKPLIVQYEVKFQNALECGGAYVKLLTENADLKLDQFLDKTPYTIMFGPDKCGSDAKYHFIIRYKNPKNGEFEEKHAKRSENIDTYFSDGKTHLYTLILRPDNTYKMFIDQTEINSGGLLTDLTPPINPEKEIVDVTDKKPEDWDDREKIPDPDAVKPDDWDENEPKMIKDASAVKPDGWLDDEEATIPDPNAVMPSDWDVETDGEWEAPKIDNPACKDGPGCGKWEAPMIENPKYKGKWRAPLITNPNFKGIWEPRKIPNPNYFEDKDPFKSIVPFSAVGLELWSMTDNIYFDNFLVTDDETVANEFAKESWLVKHTQELKSSGSSGSSVVDSVLEATKERPWLWAVFVLAGLAIIVFIFMCCCGKGGAPDQQKTDAATTKKTDAPTKDDDDAAAAQVDGEGEEDDGAQGEGEDEEERVEQEEQEIEEEEEVVADKKTKSKTASNASLDKSSPKTSPNATKRKPRKD